MSFEAEKRQYDEQGFVVVRQLLSRDDFDDLRRHLDEYISQTVPTLPDSDAFYVDRARPETLKQLQHMGHDAFFRVYSQHPSWRALAEALVGEGVTSDTPEWFNKPPGTRHVTPPHQDNYYFCLKPSHVVTIWMALDPVDAENGCLRYVAGSHRQGFRTHARSKILGFSQGMTDFSHEDFQREMAVPLEPGDVVAHHGMTVHRADANLSSTRHRRSFAMVYRGVSCQRDEDAFARYQAAARAQHEELGLQV